MGKVSTKNLARNGKVSKKDMKKVKGGLALSSGRTAIKIDGLTGVKLENATSLKIGSSSTQLKY